MRTDPGQMIPAVPAGQTAGVPVAGLLGVDIPAVGSGVLGRLPGNVQFALLLDAEAKRAVKVPDTESAVPSDLVAAIAMGLLWVSEPQPVPDAVATGVGVPEGLLASGAIVPMIAQPLIPGFGVPEETAPMQMVKADPGLVRTCCESGQTVLADTTGGEPVSPAPALFWAAPDQAAPAFPVSPPSPGPRAGGDRPLTDMPASLLAPGVAAGSPDHSPDGPTSLSAAPGDAGFGLGETGAWTSATPEKAGNVARRDSGKADVLSRMMAVPYPGPEALQSVHGPAPKPDAADPASLSSVGLGAGLSVSGLGVAEADVPPEEAVAAEPTQVPPVTPAERFWTGKLQQRASLPGADMAWLTEGRVPDPAPAEREVTYVGLAAVPTVKVREAVPQDRQGPLMLQVHGLPIMGNPDPAADPATDTAIDPAAFGSGWLQPVGPTPQAAATPQAGSVPFLAGQIVTLMKQGADGRTEIALSPDELGHVRLHLQADAQNPDRMIVHLAFDRPDTLDLFRRHADQLAEAIRAAGYGEATLSFGHSGAGLDMGGGTSADHAGPSNHSLNPPDAPADDQISTLASIVKSGLPSPSDMAVLDLRL